MDSSTSKVLSLLEQLDDEIDDLEEAISSLTKVPLLDIASKLPLLDKAKLYVLVTYAIESILFSYLRLHGVKAREHPVFTELTRVKQYFEKLKRAENPVNDGAGKRANLSLDKGAAGRIIKAGLSGNDRYDLERAEQLAKERARAHIKFAANSESMKQQELSKKRKAEDEGDAEGDATSSESDSKSESPVVTPKDTPTPKEHKKKKNKKKQKQGKNLKALAADDMDVDSGLEKEPAEISQKQRAKVRKQEKRHPGRHPKNDKKSLLEQ